MDWKSAGPPWLTTLNTLIARAVHFLVAIIAVDLLTATTKGVGEVSQRVSDVEAATVSVQAATEAVAGSVERMSAETARVQRLAILIGTGVALLSALIGGVAGAVAAHIIG